MKSVEIPLILILNTSVMMATLEMVTDAMINARLKEALIYHFWRFAETVLILETMNVTMATPTIWMDATIIAELNLAGLVAEDRKSMLMHAGQ